MTTLLSDYDADTLAALARMSVPVNKYALTEQMDRPGAYYATGTSLSRLRALGLADGHGSPFQWVITEAGLAALSGRQP